MKTAFKAMVLVAALGCILLPMPTRAHPQESASPHATATAEPRETSAPSAQDARTRRLRNEIKRILSQSQFKDLGAGVKKPLPRWLQRLRDLWEDLWATVSGGVSRAGESNPWVLFVVIGLCALVLLEMLRRVLRDSLFYTPRAQNGQGGTRMTPEELLAKAAQAHRDGNDTEAIRLVFHAALHSLFGESAKHAPSMKLAAELAASAEAPVEAFQQLNRSFEQAYYGGAEVRGADYERARSLAAALREFAGRGEDNEA